MSPTLMLDTNCETPEMYDVGKLARSAASAAQIGRFEDAESYLSRIVEVTGNIAWFFEPEGFHALHDSAFRCELENKGMHFCFKSRDSRTCIRRTSETDYSG